MDALKKIQQELKAPKSQFNSFGKYHYRSAEDILEAVKPLLAKHNAVLTLSDDVIEIGGRIYVKATATLKADETVQVTAFAREPLEKRGMDDSQITGTASSYARKYALNGLFLIDDTKDADTDEYANQIKAKPQTGTDRAISPATVESIDNLIKQTGTDRAKLLEFYKVSRIEDLKPEQAKHCITALRKKIDG